MSGLENALTALLIVGAVTFVMGFLWWLLFSVLDFIRDFIHYPRG